jgi:cytochrome c biogenesis factor
MYLILKDVHSVMRWLVLVGAAWALVRSWKGFLSNSPWTKKDRISGLVFTTLLNLNLLVGISLYLTSPLIGPMFHGGAAEVMHSPGIRFFAIEHPFMMILAVVIAQFGYSSSKRAPYPKSAFTRAALAYTLAVFLILAAIPWPFLPYGRPLLPF